MTDLLSTNQKNLHDKMHLRDRLGEALVDGQNSVEAKDGRITLLTLEYIQERYDELNRELNYRTCNCPKEVR